MLPKPRRVLKVAICVAITMVTLAALLAGCGGKGGSTGEGLPKRELPENATPEKILLEGTKATSDVRSFDFISEIKFIVPPVGSDIKASSMTMQTDGVWDNQTGNIEATLTIPELNDYKADYIIYDSRYYINVKDTWREIASDSILAPGLPDITRETSEYLKNYQTISRLDDEVINGRDCYHISMVPNLEETLNRPEITDLVRQIATQQAGRELTDAEFAAKLEEVKASLKTTGAVMEYWVDKETLVLRRTVTNMESKMQIDKSSAPITTKRITEIDFPKYNVSTDISPPEVSMEWKGN
jgi:hypothetical protein